LPGCTKRKGTRRFNRSLIFVIFVPVFRTFSFNEF
jgi:hypothetical protein